MRDRIRFDYHQLFTGISSYSLLAHPARPWPPRALQDTVGLNIPLKYHPKEHLTEIPTLYLQQNKQHLFTAEI